MAARARKLAILAKFAKQRAAFAPTSDDAPGDGEQPPTACAVAPQTVTLAAVDADAPNASAETASFGCSQGVKCALCHEATSSQHPSPMCSIVLLQRSRVLPLSLRQQLLREERQLHARLAPSLFSGVERPAFQMDEWEALSRRRPYDEDDDWSPFVTSSSVQSSPRSLVSSPLTSRSMAR